MNCSDGNARNRFHARSCHKMEPSVHIEMANKWERDDNAVLIDSEDDTELDINDVLNNGAGNKK